MTWQLQEAKNKLSQVVDDSLSKGPQIISRRGENTVVVLSYKDYQRLTKPVRSFKNLVSYYRGPEMPDVARDRSPDGRATPPMDVIDVMDISELQT